MFFFFLKAFTTRVFTKMDQILEAQQDLRKLITFLALDGTSTLGKTVRRMMSRLGTTALWSLYSMRGRKKKSFGDLPLLQVLVKACTTCHPGIRIVDVEREVAEFLKHAPFKKGGSGKVGKANPSALVSDDSDGPDTNTVLRKEQQRTVGGSTSASLFTPQEERVLAVLGTEALEGVPGGIDLCGLNTAHRQGAHPTTSSLLDRLLTVDAESIVGADASAMQSSLSLRTTNLPFYRH
ncbi:hypothetical protein ACEWY4_012700 [Coilia grayii]|uniref:Uncharacterized protein n=1 Tax=Coilia grayii TaxID=363190 RepID=A0ABD1K1A1_9TELE